MKQMEISCNLSLRQIPCADQVTELQNINAELSFENQRKADSLRSMEFLESDLRTRVESLNNRNEKLKSSDSLQKEELAVLRAEMQSLALDESRITHELGGFAMPTKCCWPKQFLSKLKMLICSKRST